jgi:hypothetical protein
MLIFIFSSYSSFFSALPLTPPSSPSPPPSPQKLNLFIIRWRIVTLKRTTFDVNGPWTLIVLKGPTPQGVNSSRGQLLKVSMSVGQKVSRSKGQ